MSNLTSFTSKFKMFKRHVDTMANNLNFTREDVVSFDASKDQIRSELKALKTDLTWLLKILDEEEDG